MSTKITSPIEGFTGRTVFGPLTVEFKDGVAEVEEKLTPGVRDYLKGRGYKIGRTTSEPSADENKAAAEKAAADAKAAADKGD